jgi:NAD(P)-dependent dehydrogenase (short-subunit alcohol dehydrogenase family)
VTKPFTRLVGAVAAYAAFRLALGRWRESRYPLRGRVVLITGGSRGLGLLVAREYARQGAKLVLTARDAVALERARAELAATGAEVLAVTADVAEPLEVQRLIDAAVAHFQCLDVVVNVAGRIEVGPLESMQRADFENALRTNFWGAYNVNQAALPELERAGGRIVNIASIGGLLSVPHLLPYSASKFALTGYSLGLGMELGQRGVRVITICPGLMRTGSPRNASFKGDHAAEYAWFSVADSLPLISMSGKRAAAAIVRACRRGDPFVVLGLPAKLAALGQGVMPGTMTRLSAGIARALPHSADSSARRGAELEPPPSWLTRASDRAARENNEM